MISSKNLLSLLLLVGSIFVYFREIAANEPASTSNDTISNQGFSREEQNKFETSTLMINNGDLTVSTYITPDTTITFTTTIETMNVPDITETSVNAAKSHINNTKHLNNIGTTSLSKTTTVSTNKTATLPPASTTVLPITPCHRFDGSSFIGGIVLTLGLFAISAVAYIFCRARNERNYHIL